jgi:hypothetical protein
MRALAAVAAALIALSAACRRPAPASEAQDEVPGATASVSPEMSAAPVDHLAPGELLEGSQRAFGVVLPGALQVKASFVDVVYASGAAPVHALARYFRARLEDGTMREGPAAATFEHVKVRGKPGLELLVRIANAPEGASVEIRDATPPPAPLLPDEASRWRQVGLTPQGRLIDPSHLE